MSAFILLFTESVQQSLERKFGGGKKESIPIIPSREFQERIAVSTCVKLLVFNMCSVTLPVSNMCSVTLLVSAVDLDC